MIRWICLFLLKERQKYAELGDLLGLELVVLVLRKGRLSSRWNRSDDASWIHSRKTRCMIRRSEKFWSIPSRCTGLEQLDKESEGEAG